MKTLLSLIFTTIVGYQTVNADLILSYLEARCKQDSCIEVKWAFVNDSITQITQGYEIQRSEDGITFEQIGWVDKINDTVDVLIYQAIDCNVLRDSLYYYRLLTRYTDSTSDLSFIVSGKVSDADCSPTGIPAPSQRNESFFITIHPNPVSWQGLITFENGNHAYRKCILFDICGKEIKSFETFENEIEITKGPITPGRYFIKLIDARGVTKGVGSVIFL